MGYYSADVLDPAIQHLLAISLAAIFAGSAAAKLYDLDVFEGAVADYRIVPRWLERPVALAVPVCESICAAGILFSATRAAAAAALALLLMAFSAAIAINLARGRREIDCGCFGPALRQQLGPPLLVRNLALIIAALSLEARSAARTLESLDFATIGCGAAVLVMVYLGVNYAIANAPVTRALKMF